MQGSPRHSLQSVPCEETKSTSFGAKNQASLRESPVPEARIGHIHSVIRGFSPKLNKHSSLHQQPPPPQRPRARMPPHTLKNINKNDNHSHQGDQLRQTELSQSHKTSTPTKSQEHPSRPGDTSQQQIYQQSEPLQHYPRGNRNRRDIHPTAGNALCPARSIEATVSSPPESNDEDCSQDALINTATHRRDSSSNVSATSQPVHNRQIQLFADPSESSDSDGDGTQTAFLKATVKIVHWNVQGANTELGRIKSTIVNEKIDIMLIQDTRLENRSDGRTRIRIPGYHTFYKAKSVNCHGLLTIVRSNLAADKIATERPEEHSEIHLD